MEALRTQARHKVCARRMSGAALAIAWLAVASTAGFARDPFDEQSRAHASSFDFKLDEEDREFVSPEAAEFDKWEPIVECDEMEDNTAKWNDPSVKPIDWVRHFGFQHSSTAGRHTGKGVPLEGTSWLNRPYHVDWFLGTLLGDELIAGQVDMNNELLAGLRIGFDFDYFWGLEWRFGWSNPNVEVAGADVEDPNGSYFISDVDLKYYPWGDSKVRPYGLLGAGLARIDFTDDNDLRQNVNLMTMPFGTGLEFHQFPWLVWRLEVLDNLAFGADGVETLNNFSFTAGMEWRFGAKPHSYWPWRPGRKLW
jgi:hypothetical protein